MPANKVTSQGQDIEQGVVLVVRNSLEAVSSCYNAVDTSAPAEGSSSSFTAANTWKAVGGDDC